MCGITRMGRASSSRQVPRSHSGTAFSVRYKSLVATLFFCESFRPFRSNLHEKYCFQHVSQQIPHVSQQHRRRRFIMLTISKCSYILSSIFDTMSSHIEHLLFYFSMVFLPSSCPLHSSSSLLILQACALFSLLHPPSISFLLYHLPS